MEEIPKPKNPPIAPPPDSQDFKLGALHPSSKSKIEPGTFRELSEADLASIRYTDTKPKKPEVKASPDLVKKYVLFKDSINPQCSVVYYPCSAYDSSPSAAFPQSRVIYVEKDQAAADALQQAGLETHLASAEEFDPGEVDVLILLNPAISAAIPNSHVKPGGYVLCNNYHSTAQELKNLKNFKFTGIIRPTKNGLLLDTKNLDDCWQEIETDEEWKNAPFDWGGASFKMMSEMIIKISGQKENLLAQYKSLIKQAREKAIQQNQKLLTNDPTMAEVLTDPEKAEILMYEVDGIPYPLVTKLPKKKGVVDDIFIFQKEKRE